MATEIAASDAAMRAAGLAWARARIYDDKLGNPDGARLAAWAESIQRWELDTPDLLEGVTRYYESDTEGRTIGIGDVLHHARESRRQRAEREKAAQIHTEAAALSAGAGYAGLPINATGRPVRAAYDIGGALGRDCPHCKAPAGEPCTAATGAVQRIPCLARMTGKPSRLGGKP
ncbi:zinc finger domain-containing protein [Nocardia cyriacigeorgica]|uniref:zinc finger domain-containing protein n=1 Tax=Nocardia cyriacigeorgica TaxID=135487 RepID=UPI0034DB3A15